MSRFHSKTTLRGITAAVGATLIAGAAIVPAAAMPLSSSSSVPIPSVNALEAAATSSWDANRAAGPAIEVQVDGLLKPNSELLVSTSCTADDQSAVAIASFGGVTVLRPAADRGALIGTLVAPNNIGPGPNGGPHVIKVVCQSGANSTVALPSAGNGDALRG